MIYCKWISWSTILSIAILAMPALAEDDIISEPESTVVRVKDPNAAPVPTLDLSQYAVKITREGTVLNIQYTADNSETQRLLRKYPPPSLEIYKGDLLLGSGSFEFG